MPARRLGKKAMTPAQKQKRYRERKKPNSTVAKQLRRAEREKALAEATRKASEALGAKLYGVLYIDPPWRDQTADGRACSGLNKAADNHYPTMSLAELAALALPAAKDCVLFLWAGVETLPAALALVETWGFEYRTHCVWQKTDGPGLGHWYRCAHELLLIAARGEVPAPAPGTQFSSVIAAPRGAHSEKPEVFAEMIAHYYPSVPKLEMFARAQRAGWDVWGNELAAT